MLRFDIDTRCEKDSDVFAEVEKERARLEKRTIVQLGPESEKFGEVMKHYSDRFSISRFTKIIDLVGRDIDLLNMVVDAALEVSAIQLGANMHSGAFARLYTECKIREASNMYNGWLFVRVIHFIERFV